MQFSPFSTGNTPRPGASQKGFVVASKRRDRVGTTHTGRQVYELDIDLACWMFFNTAPEVLRLGRALYQRQLRPSAHNLVVALELHLFVIRNILRRSGERVSKVRR